MPESEVIKEILANLGPGERLFRANSGQGYTGKPVFMKNGVLKLLGYRVFRAMPEGFPDLIGWKTITVTPEMVGKQIAVFWGKEVKTGKLQPTKAQRKFGEVLEKMGGIFEVFRG